MSSALRHARLALRALVVACVVSSASPAPAADPVDTVTLHGVRNVGNGAVDGGSPDF